MEIKDLAETASIQCRTANRLFLALLTVSYFALVGGREVSKNGKLVEVPLLGINVPFPLFLASSLVILSLLMIAFASAQMQAHLALLHAQKKILAEGSDQDRDEFDRSVVGTLSRVAPVDQALAEEGVTWRPARMIIYAVLKIAYWGVAFFFPIWALKRCIQDMTEVDWFMWPVAGVAAVLFAGMLLIELLWVWRRLKRLWRRS